MTKLDAFGLNKTPKSFDVRRYVYLKRICQQLSRDQRSVQIADHLMLVILDPKDAKDAKACTP